MRHSKVRHKIFINLGGYVDHSPFMSGGMKVVQTHFSAFAMF